jgi:hypothetical protein
MLEYFYHQVIRKVVVAFGTLFNNIHIARYDSNGNEVERIKVPIGYGPQQKFIRRLNRIGRDFEERNIKYENYLPRISFEMQQLTYDSARKLSTLNRTVSYIPSSSSSVKSRYERVPYNIDFQLGIMAKNTEDALQIIEQILPYFQPDYTVTIILNESTDPRVDVPFVFKSATLSEGSDGSYDNYDTRKVTYVNMVFTAKFYLYGPIRESKIITGTEINLDLSGLGLTNSTVTVSATVEGATAGTSLTASVSGHYALDGYAVPANFTIGTTGISTNITEY